jgi:hypothetical protein
LFLNFRQYPGNDTLRGQLFGFWVVTVKPGFVFCYDPQQEVLVISDFIQQFLADKYIPTTAYARQANEAQTSQSSAACSNPP